MANGDDIRDIWTSINKMSDKVEVMHTSLSKQISEIDKKVAVAIKDMENQGSKLSQHLSRHWQVYIALAVPIATSLVGVAILAVRS